MSIFFYRVVHCLRLGSLYLEVYLAVNNILVYIDNHDASAHKHYGKCHKHAQCEARNG